MIAKVKELKGKIRLSADTKMVLWEIFLFILGFVFMSVRFLFGTFPLGLALMGASKKYAPFVFAGGLLSVLFVMEEKPLYVVALLAILALRIAASFIKKSDNKKTELGQKQGKGLVELLFCEGVELRVAVASIVALGIGVYTVIANGYAYYDIFVLIFNTVFVGIFTYCLCGAFEGKGTRARLRGVCAVGFCLAYAFSGKEIKGVDIALILSCAIVLYVSKHLGGIKGGLIGALLGVALGSVGSAVLGVVGLVSGFLWAVSPYLAVMCSFILGMGYAVSQLGYTAIVSYTPELLAASLIMYPVLRFGLLPKLSIAPEETSAMAVYQLKTESAETGEKITALSQAFERVAKMLRGVSQKTKNPDKKGYEDISLEVCEEHCYSCPKEGICWQRDIETTEANINKMGEALFLRKKVEKGDVEEKFLHRCPNVEKVMEQLNEKTKALIESSVKNDKLDISAQDYEATGKLISAIFKNEGVSQPDKEMTDKAVRVCASCGLVCEKIQVVGSLCKKIIATGVDVQRSKCTSAELRAEMEKSLGIELKEAELEEEEGYATLTMERKNNLIPQISQKAHTSEKDEVNGDTFAAFEGFGKQYMVICDGMGSGRDAKITSQLCAELIESLLPITGEKEIVLSMLNNFVRAKNLEFSSTVDLFELDLISGEGSFIKSGAAPSFVKRGDKVFMLQSKTAPIGIMKGLDAEQLTCTLNKGDICVMVSDGIVPAKQDGAWLSAYLSEYKGADAEELSAQLLEEAKRRGTGDDMTVACAVIN